MKQKLCNSSLEYERKFEISRKMVLVVCVSKLQSRIRHLRVQTGFLLKNLSDFFLCYIIQLGVLTWKFARVWLFISYLVCMKGPFTPVNMIVWIATSQQTWPAACSASGFGPFGHTSGKFFDENCAVHTCSTYEQLSSYSSNRKLFFRLISYQNEWPHLHDTGTSCCTGSKISMVASYSNRGELAT